MLSKSFSFFAAVRSEQNFLLDSLVPWDSLSFGFTPYSTGSVFVFSHDDRRFQFEQLRCSTTDRRMTSKRQSFCRLRVPAVSTCCEQTPRESVGFPVAGTLHVHHVVERLSCRSDKSYRRPQRFPRTNCVSNTGLAKGNSFRTSLSRRGQQNSRAAKVTDRKKLRSWLIEYQLKI